MSRSIPLLLVTAAVFTASLGGAVHAATLPPTGVPTYAPDVEDLAGDFFTEGPTSPGRWLSDPSGIGTSVSYSLMRTGLGTLNGALSVALSEFMPTGYGAQIVAAFDAWSAVADISFMEVTDPGVDWQSPGAEASDIRIAGVDIDGPRGVLARAFFPPRNGGAAAGDIHLDISETWKIGFGGPGFDLFQVFAHEIGHSIGLGHSCNCTDALMNPFYTENFRGLQPDDIAGATSIYGERLMAPVPLPAALPLMGVALALLAGLGLRRRRGSRITT